MQENLVITNVWLEKKFKGYNYLTKGVRRKMYKDTEEIVKKFMEFCDTHFVSEDSLKKELDAKGITYPSGNTLELQWLACICGFLRPGLYYEYIKTSSFGKLLKDPNKTKLQGDCNQIVTLYIYLYSLKFPVNDLQIKLLPEHVCLHFKGVDVEATAGGFTKYPKFDYLLPVTEIISTNLLDLNDFREETQKISEREMVKSAQLAYAISSLKDLAEKNLEIAYHNLGISAMKNNNFQSAIFYISKTKNREILPGIYQNACAHYVEIKDFEKAKYYARESRNNDLINQVEKSALAKEYNDLAKTVSGVKTIDDAKKYKSEYRKMLELARKLGDERMVSQMGDILGKI
jgi:hypothetical protein